jgi:hypothetical protein
MTSISFTELHDAAAAAVAATAATHALPPLLPAAAAPLSRQPSLLTRKSQQGTAIALSAAAVSRSLVGAPGPPTLGGSGSGGDAAYPSRQASPPTSLLPTSHFASRDLPEAEGDAAAALRAQLAAVAALGGVVAAPRAKGSRRKGGRRPSPESRATLGALPPTAGGVPGTGGSAPSSRPPSSLLRASFSDGNANATPLLPSIPLAPASSVASGLDSVGGSKHSSAAAAGAGAGAAAGAGGRDLPPSVRRSRYSLDELPRSGAKIVSAASAAAALDAVLAAATASASGTSTTGSGASGASGASASGGGDASAAAQ